MGAPNRVKWKFSPGVGMSGLNLSDKPVSVSSRPPGCNAGPGFGGFGLRDRELTAGHTFCGNPGKMLGARMMLQESRIR